MKKKNFVVIGLGRYGKNVAIALEKMNCEILAIDNREDVINDISKLVHHSVVADATKIDVLMELGVESIDHAVVAIGNNLEASILTVSNLKQVGVKQITVRVDEENHKEIFKLLGASEIILPEEAAAVELANQIYSDSILEYHAIAGNYEMVKIIVSKNFESKSIIDLNIRNTYNVNIVGIIRDDKFFIPHSSDTINPLDIIVTAGEKNNIKKFTSFLEK